MKPSEKQPSPSPQQAEEEVVFIRGPKAVIHNLPPGTGTFAVNGKGIAAAHPEQPATLNGEPIKPAEDPLSRRLTGEALALRENQKKYLRERGINLGGADPQLVGPIDLVVMSPANPFLSLYREYRGGLITFAQLEEAIDVAIISDEKMISAYEKECEPTKPLSLEQMEADIARKVDPDELTEAIAKLHGKLAAAQPEVAHYLRSIQRVRVKNMAALYWLRYILTRQADKNLIYADRLRRAIYTHEFQA